MRISRLYVSEDLVTGHRLTLGADAANYLGRVLRARVGDAVTLFNGRGGEYAATIAGLERRQVLIDIGAYVPANRETALSVTLLQGLARGERMDYAVQKATELGVTRVVPVITDRSQVQLGADRRERRREHWAGIAIAAAQQSGRTAIPAIDAISDLSAAVGDLPAGDGLRLVADLTDSPAWPAAGAGPVVLAIGPEGGFSATDIAVLHGAGFVSVGLGPRILRTETAAVVALTLLQQRYGDLVDG